MEEIWNKLQSNFDIQMFVVYGFFFSNIISRDNSLLENLKIVSWFELFQNLKKEGGGVEWIILTDF